jgi:hypothetical protein
MQKILIALGLLLVGLVVTAILLYWWIISGQSYYVILIPVAVGWLYLNYIRKDKQVK